MASNFIGQNLSADKKGSASVNGNYFSESGGKEKDAEKIALNFPGYSGEADSL
jgi:hypothetical protein